MQGGTTGATDTHMTHMTRLGGTMRVATPAPDMVGVAGSARSTRLAGASRRSRLAGAGARQRVKLLGVMLALCLAPLLLAGCQSFTLSGTNTKGTTASAQIQHGDNGAILVIVQLTIKGHGPYPFALDTGASISLIDRALARQLGLAVTGPPEDIAGIGGSERVIPVQAQDWSLGAIKLPTATISSGPISTLSGSTGIEGLLGSDVLSHFGAVTIDYDAGTVTVYQQAS